MRSFIVFVLFLTLSTADAQTEKVILHHDKPYYFAGDDIHFSVHLLSSSIEKADDYSELVYIKLIDKNDKIVSEGSVLTDGKSADGTLNISESQSGGNYELVAFTNRLRNLGESGFFRKRIPIINDLMQVSDSSKKVNIDIVAEGGQLVGGVSSRLALHVTDIYGKGIPATVELLEGNQVIKTLQCDSYGLGTFYFKPIAGEKYQIKLKEHELNQMSFPKIEKSGSVLQVRMVKEAVQIILQTNDKKDAQVRLVMRSGPIGLYDEEQTISHNKPLALNFNLTSLPKELLDIIVFGDDGEVLNTRSFMAPNNDSIRVQMQVDQSQINPADSVGITVHSSKEALLSFSVLDTAYTNHYRSDPLAELHFDSQLLDRCVLSSIPVSSLDYAALDNLLFFRSLPTYPKSTTYESENYLYLKGILTDSKPLPMETKIFFFVPGINTTYETTADSSGRFAFPMLFDFYGRRQIIFTALHRNHTFDNPQIIENLTVTSKLNLKRPVAVSPSMVLQAEEQQRLNTIYKSYQYFKEPDDVNDPFMVESIFTSYVLDINMKEYIDFKSMEEVIKEIMPGVQLRGKANNKTLRVYSKEAERSFDQTPLIFIDNKPTFNIDHLLTIDPSDVESIKVVNSLDQFQKIGSFAENGVIIIKLKLNNLENSDETNIYSASGLLKYRIGFKPNPDFRDVLFYQYAYIDQDQTFRLNVHSSYRPSKYKVIAKVIGKGFVETVSKDVVVK